MDPGNLFFIVDILLFLTGTVILISRDWRLSIGALSVQYAGVFALVLQSWPFETAVVKLVTGWMAGAVLGIALLNIPEERIFKEKFTLSEVVFRVLVAILLGMLAVSWGPRLLSWFPEISYQQAIGGLLLIGLGLFHLSLTALPMRVVLGLLTLFSGFEVLYAAIERSVLVIGLLALVNLGLALVAAYLLGIYASEVPE